MRPVGLLIASVDTVENVRDYGCLFMVLFTEMSYSSQIVGENAECTLSPCELPPSGPAHGHASGYRF